MNPLDLTGPEFLRFFLPYGICVLALAWLLRAAAQYTLGPRPDARWTPGAYPREGDAYAIAFLRGGAPEAVRTVMARLVGAGLLNVESRLVRSLGEPDVGAVQLQPIEQTAWSALTPGVPMPASEAEQRVRDASWEHLASIETLLTGEGLLLGYEGRRAYWFLTALAWLATAGLGLAKLAVALSRGRTNIGFLLILVAAFTFAVFRWLSPPRQTNPARRYLDWLQESHRGLVAMLTAGQRNGAGELALATGIYGLTSIPALANLGIAFQPVQPVRRDASSSCSASSCGSSGSSDSGGSSCGGGCGGGGCGGCGG
jgi:uncharacterized protein (TIGR04222 family)